MDWQPLHGLSGIQAPTWGIGRIQRKVYVGPDGFTRELLCYTSRSCARNLSQLLFTCNALAIPGTTPGGLNGLGSSSRRDKARDQLPAVLDIRRASVSGRLRAVQGCESIPSCQERLSFAAGCEVRT